jgi:Skp family chaperone for outer membrane proteins
MNRWILCALLLVSSVWAASIDEQIAAANRAADSLKVTAHRLGSQKAAARLDSLYQADSTLAANSVHVVSGGRDSMWVNLVLRDLSALTQKLVKAELKAFNVQATSSPDTLYIRRDHAEKALPVISVALKTP